MISKKNINQHENYNNVVDYIFSLNLILNNNDPKDYNKCILGYLKSIKNNNYDYSGNILLIEILKLHKEKRIILSFDDLLDIFDNSKIDKKDKTNQTAIKYIIENNEYFYNIINSRNIKIFIINLFLTKNSEFVYEHISKAIEYNFISKINIEKEFLLNLIERNDIVISNNVIKDIILYNQKSKLNFNRDDIIKLFKKNKIDFFHIKLIAENNINQNLGMIEDDFMFIVDFVIDKIKKNTKKEQYLEQIYFILNNEKIQENNIIRIFNSLIKYVPNDEIKKFFYHVFSKGNISEKSLDYMKKYSKIISTEFVHANPIK